MFTTEYSPSVHSSYTVRTTFPCGPWRVYALFVSLLRILICRFSLSMSIYTVILYKKWKKCWSLREINSNIFKEILHKHKIGKIWIIPYSLITYHWGKEKFKKIFKVYIYNTLSLSLMFLIRRWNGMRYKWVGITFSLHGPNRRQREAMHLKLMWNFNMTILSLNVSIDWFCLLRTPRGFFNQKSGFTCPSGAILYERINFLRNGCRKNRKQFMCLIFFYQIFEVRK